MIQKNTKVFVTGVAGMIGSNLARRLIQDGYSVIGIDNLWRGTLENIAVIRDHDNFSFRYADLISDNDWYRDMESEDILIHIADIVAGISYVFSNEWSVFQKNLLINTNVARVVNLMTPAKLVYLGTACSYPQEMQRSVSSSKLKESDKLPADPESGYGWSKLAGEIEFRLATKETDTQFTVLDLHNVYGWPCAYKDNTSQVIPSLINKAISSTDGKLSVWGNGQQGRAFVHVNDVVDAIKLSIQYNGNQSTFMIGPDRCTTIAEVATIIQQHPRIEIDEIIFDPSKPTGDIGRFADASLAATELGWQLQMDFEQGIHALIDRIVEDAA